jgi:hypothetical protein
MRFLIGWAIFHSSTFLDILLSLIRSLALFTKNRFDQLGPVPGLLDKKGGKRCHLLLNKDGT